MCYAWKLGREKMKFLRKILGSLRSLGLPIVFVSLIILTILILYWQDLSILANEAIQNEATNHIILVPFLASFMIYRKKELAKASLAIERFRGKSNAVSLSEITGIALCLSAFLLYWYGSYSFYPLEYHVASLTIFLIGITLTLFSVKMLMALIFPILFLAFLTPPPSAITLTAGAALGIFNAQASLTLLKILGVPVTLSSEYGPPTIVINNPLERSLEFAVDQACSGIYSLTAFTMFAAFLIYIVRGSITKKIALLPLGLLTLPILNILRISLIVFIAYRFGEPIAMTIFHTFSGWLILSLGMLLLLLIAEKLLHVKIFEPKSKIVSCPKCDDTLRSSEMFCLNCGKFLGNRQTKLDKKFWIKIISLLLASCVVAFSIQAPVFAFAQGLTLTNADPEASTSVFPQASDYQLIFLYRDQNFEKMSRQDASLLYAYFPQNVSNPTIYLLVGVANSITNLHSWEVCLVTWQTAQGSAPAVKTLESRDIQIMQNPPIIARYFVFQYPSDHRALANYTQVTLYWYQKALFRTGLSVEPRYTRISLFILTKNPNDSPKLEQKLLKMGKSIADYWEPLKVQSIVSLGIPTMQVLLGSSTLCAIIVQASQYIREWRRKTTNLKIFKKLGSPEDKLLYQTAKELSQKTKETTALKIVSALEKATGNATKPNELINTLSDLEKHGIIRVDIINIRNQPTLVWKP